MYGFGGFSGCHGNGRQEFKKRGKMDISVICVVLRCHLFPVDTPKGFSMVIKNFLNFFLDQFTPTFYMTNIFVV